MALHCKENWDDMTGRNRRAVFVLDPPFIEGAVSMDEETLFWRGGFGKGV